MNTTVGQLNEVLAWLGNSAQKAEGFVLEQAPIIAQEVVAYTFWTGIAGMVVLGFIGLILIALSVLVGWSERDWSVPAIGILLGCFFLAMSTAPGWQAVKATIAPRVVVIEWVQAQLSQVSK